MKASDHTLIYVVVPHGHEGADHVIVAQLDALGLDSVVAHAASAPQDMQALIGRGREPSVVVIAPGVAHPTAVARALRAVWPLGQILFVPATDQYAAMISELRYIPMLGPNWSVVELGDPHLGDKIVQAARATRQRTRLRTTLDRANLRLAAPKAVDSVEYRQSVISEHYLASLLQHASDAIFSLDPRNNVLYWSAGAERLLRFRPRPGQPVRQLPFWSAELDSLLADIVSGKSPVSAQVSVEVAAQTLHLAVSLARVQDENQAFIGTSITVRDQSEIVRALATERAARQHAERLGRVKDEFLALLSHELRTPLSAVIGRTQLLRMQHRDAPALQASLEVIERNARLQARLIDDLLDISSIISGKLTLERRTIVVGDLLRTAIDSIRNIADAKRIRLHTDEAATPATVAGDAYRLQQVLNNILSNAVKFTPEGGLVRVRAEAGPDQRIRIVIEDTGCGIAKEFLPHVFDKFGQEDASLTRQHGGLGLGLSIAKQITEMHDGTISVASPGRGLGTRFTLTLPIGTTQERRGPERPRATMAAQSSVLGQIRVLVVEDAADTRALIQDVLSVHGAQVVTADSAASALALLRTDVSDLLVSDIGMPEMDGYQFIAQVRKLGLSSDRLPAVALTAFASESDRQRAFDAGFQAHVTKPNVVTELVSRVLEVLATRGRRPATV